MTIEEAKAYLEGIGLFVNLPVHNDIRLRGGSRHEAIGAGEFKVKIVIDPFHIIYYKQIWIVEIAAYWAIISVSQELRDVAQAIENFFKLSERDHEKYNEIGFALRTFPPRAIVAIVDSDLARPSILVASAPLTRVENYFTFILENAHLATQSAEYRIYPHEGQWAFQRLLEDESPPQLASNLEQATQGVLELCGRK